MTHAELLEKLGLAQQQIVDLKVDNSIKDTRISELEKSLREARAEVRGYELGTQTMRKLQILGDSDDNDGFDPYETGAFKSPWERAR